MWPKKKVLKYPNSITPSFPTFGRALGSNCSKANSLVDMRNRFWSFFSTPMPAHVLLVPRHCSTNPLTISESFCMGGGAVINWWTDAILTSCACCSSNWIQVLFIICLKVSSVGHPAIVPFANMRTWGRGRHWPQWVPTKKKTHISTTSVWSSCPLLMAVHAEGCCDHQGSASNKNLSWVCRMLVSAILGPKCRVGRHVGNMSPNVGPTFGDIASFWAPTMSCCFCRLPTCWLHVHRNLY